ncbi:MAG: DinB family protein [Vicinamibacteria bacterium]|nr:DinB family protein [Vicinamibacteria bacterium]
MRLAALLCITVLVSASSALAQDNPFTPAAKSTLALVKGNVVKAAEQMPETDYAFKPTPDVRSFGQLIGHVANANYMICSTATGAANPSAGDIEKTKTSKADLTKAVAESFAFCEAQFDALTPAKAAEVVDVFGMKMPRLNALQFNTSHDFEHYGNIVTYMRLKGMVPPSSQRGM